MVEYQNISIESDIFKAGDVIDHSYFVITRLGRGGYGEIYQSKRITDGCVVAVKVERLNKSGNLLEEEKILRILQAHKARRIPKILASGKHQGVSYLVMELLGESIASLRAIQPGRTFTLSSTCALSILMLLAIKEVHDYGFLHRDVKPANFLMGGSQKPGKLVIIDFGLSRRYMKPDGTLIARQSRDRCVGSRRYMSPNTHLQKDLARRDDLWGLLYLTVEMYTGSLPWSHLRGIQNLEKLKEMKFTANELLTQDLPIEFTLILNHIKSLSFFSRPNYRYLHFLLYKMFIASGGKRDMAFDWEKNNPIADGEVSSIHLSFSSINSASTSSFSEITKTLLLNRNQQNDKSLGDLSYSNHQPCDVPEFGQAKHFQTKGIEPKDVSSGQLNQNLDSDHIGHYMMQFVSNTKDDRKQQIKSNVNPTTNLKSKSKRKHFCIII